MTTTVQPATIADPTTIPTTVAPLPLHPQVTEVSRESLTIKGLPPVTHHQLYESALLNICLGVKKLFKDGDHGGKKAYRRKRRNQEPLENDRVRLCIVYTTQLYHDESGHQAIRINFWTSNTENSSYWLGANGAKRAMTPREINQCAELFSQTCAEEITQFIDSVYYAAIANGETADYYAPAVAED